LELILIRHGQSESNARLTTHLDAALTPLGVKQAHATADYLLDHIFSDSTEKHILVSPFRRTLQTCEPLAVRLPGIAEAYPRMCEFFSPEVNAYEKFSGQSEEEIKKNYPGISTDECGGRACWWPEKLESLSDIYGRMQSVRDDLWGRYGEYNSQVVLYSHAEPIGRLIEVLLHADPNPGWPPWTQNCGIDRLTVNSNIVAATLDTFNDISHLTALGLVSPIFQ